MKKNGYNYEPVEAANINGKLYIIDGHHRAEAVRKAEIKDIPIKVLPISKEHANIIIQDAANAYYKRY